MSVKTNPRYLEGPYIPLTQKGQPNGVATLDSTGKVPLSQLPPFASGGVNYDTTTTIGAKMVRSIGTGADTISETGITIDSSDNVSGIENLTVDNDINVGGDLNVVGTSTFDGPTVFNDSVTIGAGPLIFDNTVTQGDQIFDSTYTGNYNGSTLNYTSVLQNYVAPALISCATLPSFGVTYSYPANATQVEVKVTNTAVQYTFWQAVNQGSQTYTVGSGTISIDTTLTGVVVTSLTGTNTLDSACFYTGNVVNQNGVIQNNTNNTVNNTGGTVNNTNQTINNTNTTTFGGTYTGVTLTNVTITSSQTTSGVVEVNQVAHGLSLLDWVRFDETSSVWVKAQANSVGGLGSWHVVKVVDANNFFVAKDGTYKIPNALPFGEYVLSDATAGGYVQTLPTNNSSYILYGMEVIDANTVNFYTVIGVSVATISGSSYSGIYSRFIMYT